MLCVCSGYNTRSDWLILRQSSTVMPTGRLRCCKAMAFCNTPFFVLILLPNNCFATFQYIHLAKPKRRAPWPGC